MLSKCLIFFDIIYSAIQSSRVLSCVLTADAIKSPPPLRPP